MGAKILASRGITYERVQGALDLTPQALTVIVTFNGVNKDIIEILSVAWQLATEHAD
jgi:DNA-binding MurR/RpiR family transcriptional regulator